MVKYYFILIIIFVQNSLSFDYLEHSYFTDRSCHLAQQKLAAELDPTDTKLLSRYLALGLVCPDNFDQPYCHDDYKIATGHINLLDSPPEKSGDLSITLGDFSALGDHLSEYGLVKGVPQLNREGLISNMVEWLLEETETIGGFIEDVAEDACEIDDLVSWKMINRDIDSGIGSNGSIDNKSFNISNRLPIVRGPSDPAGAYSFDNPQYLDLVLNNYHHFGKASYNTWLGFHSAAIDLQDQRCEELIEMEECQDLKRAVQTRVLLWSKRAPEKLILPLNSFLLNLSADTGLTDSSNIQVMNNTISALLSLVVEGGGLHFLQDNFSGGHIRTKRGSYNLEDARHYHDFDGKHGLLANVRTWKGRRNFLAYGDSYLMGKGTGEEVNPICGGSNKKENTNCLLREQRGVLASVSVASILDWSKGGTLFTQKDCEDSSEVNQFICQNLPTHSVEEGIVGNNIGHSQSLGKGTLPPSRPPFSYQSILFSNSLSFSEGSTDGLQTGLRLIFLSQLGERANWMTSYNYGFYFTNGDSFKQYHAEFSYMFHFRWAARFLINGAPYLQLSRSRILDKKRSSISLGPRIGLTFLPEGWIRMPLEITTSFKVPLEFFNDVEYFVAPGVPNQWFEISIGLSFI